MHAEVLEMETDCGTDNICSDWLAGTLNSKKVTVLQTRILAVPSAGKVSLTLQMTAAAIAEPDDMLQEPRYQ